MDAQRTIQALIEKRQKLLDGKRNRDAQALFVKRTPEIPQDKFRELPRRLFDTHGKIPIIVCLDRPMWARLLGFRLDRFYQDPDYFLENQLRMDVYHLENLADDLFFDESIQVPGGASFESTLFGMRQAYGPKSEPWLDHAAIVNNAADLAQLSTCDFYSAGPMPAVLQFHERLLELLAHSGMKPILPGWIRGPLGVAENLRGTERLLMDLLSDPGFACALLRCVVEARKSWCLARDKYLGSSSVRLGVMYDDEVQVPMLSPRMYRQHILPLEQELCQFHGGLRYWHSCGDAAPFVPFVAEIPRIEMMHCGPYSDLDKIVGAFAGRCALEVAVPPRKHFLEASEEGMRASLEDTMSILRRHSAEAAVIRLTVYEGEGMGTLETAEKARRWLAIARDVTSIAW